MEDAYATIATFPVQAATMIRSSLAFVAAVLFGLGAASAQPNEGKVYTHNARGQVASIADPAHPETDATYSYDDNGNRTGKLQGGIVTTYQWDARDRLVGVLRDGQPLVRYRYDYAGRRVEKETLVAPLILVRFQYSGPLLESESNVIGNTIARYQRAADGRVISYRRLGTIWNVATDALGTPVALLSEQGSAVARYSYDSWGNRKQLDGTEEIPVGHTGYYFDKETGLYYAGARYYDPAIGAFISEDPVEGDIERPVTQNRYVAFNANPTAYTDPDGRCGLAAMDASECINNVAVANGWSAERRLEEQQIQHEAEVRSAPGKLFNTLTFVIAGPIIRGSLAAGLSAYSATGSARWGLAVAATRAAPLAEPAAQVIADVPGPGTIPIASLPSTAARAEAALVQEAQQARAAASFADDVPQSLANLPDPPPLPRTSASVVLEGSDGIPKLAPSTGAGPVGETGPPARVLSMETGPYSEMTKRADISGQAHHLNQDSMYRDHIPHGDAVTVKLEGNAFTEPGTPHYLVHQAQEAYLDQFRKRNSPRYRERPTNTEMTRAMVDALRKAGYSEEQSMILAREAIRDRVNYGLLGGENVPRMPGRINQKKPAPANEP